MIIASSHDHTLMGPAEPASPRPQSAPGTCVAVSNGRVQAIGQLRPQIEGWNTAEYDCVGRLLARQKLLVSQPDWSTERAHMCNVHGKETPNAKESTLHESMLCRGVLQAACRLGTSSFHRVSQSGAHERQVKTTALQQFPSHAVKPTQERGANCKEGRFIRPSCCSLDR
jgi:hypothetical protein